jgi:putative methyltransferase (TIGR04325 family)
MTDRNQQSGYENLELINSIIDKTVIIKESMQAERRIYIDSFRVFAALILGNRDVTRVVDLGGAAGYHYFNLKTALPSKELKWTIVETSLFCEVASRREELHPLIFCDNLEEAFSQSGEVDLLYSSRALQYLNDPIKTLNEICKLAPKFIFLSGIAFSPDKDIHVYEQISKISSNGPQIDGVRPSTKKVRYNLKLIPQQAIEEILEIEYVILLRISEEPLVHIYKGQIIPYTGLWAVRKDLVDEKNHPRRDLLG